MYCPFCNEVDSKVIDSRHIDGTNEVRRRRSCVDCGARFTTYEKFILEMPRVVKRDGSRCIFSEDKLRAGLHKATEKRPISVETIEKTISTIICQIRKVGEAEISSEIIGQMVMIELKNLDHVAYVRFASVYRRFDDAEAFQLVLNDLLPDEA